MAVTNQLDIEIKSQSDKATKSLDGLISKLNEVNSALNGLNVNNIQNIANSLKGLKGVKVNIGGSSNAMGSANNQFTRADSLIKTLTQTANKANTGFLNLNKTVFKMAATWGMFYASAYPFIRMLNAAWQSSQSAMDYVETYNYYSVTMDKIFGQVGEDAADSFQNSYVASLKSISEKMTGFSIGINGELFENYSKNLGADPEALMNYQARIGAVTNAVGLMAQQSVDAQKALSMLSQDLSSLTNTPLESVMTNLSSGLIGQSRALYKYGIDITNATLKEYAFANGITKSVSAMSQAEKMQLRLVAILDQSKVAWGDMANTVNSVSNQYRIFTQNVSNMSRVLGNLFLPIVSKVLPYVNALMIALRQMFTLLGFKLYGDNWLSQTLDGISSGYAGDDVVDGLEDIEDAADDASGSAKKLKKALMGFDELNIIDPNSSSGSGSGSGGAGIDLTDAIEAALGDYESIWNKAFADAENKAVNLANRIMDYIKSGNFEGLGKWISTSLKNQLDSINWEEVYQGARDFGKGLAQFMNGLIRPSTFYSVGKTIAGALNTAIYASLEFGKEFDFKKLGVAIGSYWNGIFDNFDFAAFGETVGVWVGGIVATIGNAIKTIKWDTLFDGIKKGINGFFKGIGESDMTISDLAIVIGFVTIKKILKLSWGAMVGKAISQSLAKVIASKLGTEIAADAGITTAIASGLAVQFANVKSKLSFAITDFINPLSSESFGTSLARYFGATVTTVTGALSGLGGSLLVVHEIFDMVENGIDAVSVALTALGAGIVAFGVVIGGPIAAAAAGIGALLGVIYELTKATLELNEIHNEELFNEIIQGTEKGTHSLQDFVDHMKNTIDIVSTGMENVNAKFETLENSRSQIKQTVDEIDTIGLAMQSGRELTDSQIETLNQSFESLKTQLEQTISASYDYVIAQTMADYQYLEATGQITEADKQRYINRMQDLYDLKDATLENAAAVAEAVETERQNYAKAQEDYNNHKISLEELTAAENKYYDALLGLSSVASQYTGDMDGVNQATQNAIDSVKSFEGSLDLTDANLENWEDLKTEVNGTIDGITQAYIDGAASIKEEGNKVVEEMKTNGSYTEEWAAEHEKTMQARLSDLRSAYQTELNGLNNDLLEIMPQIIATASEKWDELSSAEQALLYGYDKKRYIKEKFRDYANEVINGEDGLSASLTKAFSTADLVPDTTLEETTASLTDKIFSTTIYAFSNGQYDVEIAESYQSIINDALTNVDVSKQAEASGGYIVEGTAKGIEAASNTLTTAATNMGNTVLSGFNKNMGINSPSTVMFEDAFWVVEGLNKGIEQYSNETTVTTMQAWALLITTSFNEAFTDALTGIQDIFGGLVPYFEDDVFALLNSALENEIGTVQETITTSYEDFQAQTDEMLLGIEDSFSLATASINEMFTTMWTTIKSTSVTGANAMASVMQNALNNMASGMNSFLADTENALRRVAEESGTSFGGLPRVGTVTIPRLNINAYRVGGFPEDGLFYANHTELVGQFTNGRTAVANNEQIVEGIRSGVASAVREELGYYLQDIADNTSATASNTEDIKNQPSSTMSNRDIARANRIGSRSMGLTLRTT